MPSRAKSSQAQPRPPGLGTGYSAASAQGLAQLASQGKGEECNRPGAPGTLGRQSLSLKGREVTILPGKADGRDSLGPGFPESKARGQVLAVTRTSMTLSPSPDGALGWKGLVYCPPPLTGSLRFPLSPQG